MTWSIKNHMKKILSYVLLVVLIALVVFVFRSEPRRNSVFSLQTNVKETKENPFPPNMNPIAKSFYEVKWDRYDSLLEAVYEFYKVSLKVNDNEKKEMTWYLYKQFEDYYNQVIAPVFEETYEGDHFLLKEDFYKIFIPFKIKPALVDFANQYCAQNLNPTFDKKDREMILKRVNPEYVKEFAQYPIDIDEINKKITCLGYVWISDEYGRNIKINESFLKFFLGNVSPPPEQPKPTSY